MTFPDDDAENPFHANLSDSGEDSENSTSDDEMTTSLKCVDGEATQVSLWDLGNTNNATRQSVPSESKTSASVPIPSSSSSTAVEALSTQMVSDIIHEVTRKSSLDVMKPPDPPPAISAASSAENKNIVRKHE